MQEAYCDVNVEGMAVGVSSLGVSGVLMERASDAVGSEACSWSRTLRAFWGASAELRMLVAGNRGMTPHTTPNKTPVVVKAKHKGRSTAAQEATVIAVIHCTRIAPSTQ